MAVQQIPGITRTDLQQHDTTVEAGEVFFVPAETVHAVKNLGSGNATELATYVVEKGKPLLVPVE